MRGLRDLWILLVRVWRLLLLLGGLTAIVRLSECTRCIAPVRWHSTQLYFMVSQCSVCSLNDALCVAAITIIEVSKIFSKSGRRGPRRTNHS